MCFVYCILCTYKSIEYDWTVFSVFRWSVCESSDDRRVHGPFTWSSVLCGRVEYEISVVSGARSSLGGDLLVIDDPGAFSVRGGMRMFSLWVMRSLCFARNHQIGCAFPSPLVRNALCRMLNWFKIDV